MSKKKKNKKFDVAITYGTYDLFHPGHVKLFKRIKKQCKKLIVVVSTDEFNSSMKSKTSIMNTDDRITMVKSCKYVDKVLKEESWDQKISDIEKYGVDVLFMGDDWEGKFDELLRDKCKVVILPRTKSISSTEIKSRIKES